MFIVDSKREHIFMHTAYVCYRYAILGWRSGSNMQQPRQLIKNDVEQLLIWLPKCTKILVCLELPNTMFMVSASFCGHCYRKRNRSNMVIIFCICSKQFQQIKTTMHDDETLKQTTQSTSASPITFCFTAIMWKEKLIDTFLYVFITTVLSLDLRHFNLSLMCSYCSCCEVVFAVSVWCRVILHCISCILLRCNWPFVPFVYKKINWSIDWLIVNWRKECRRTPCFKKVMTFYILNNSVKMNRF